MRLYNFYSCMFIGGNFSICRNMQFLLLLSRLSLFRRAGHLIEDGLYLFENPLGRRSSVDFSH